MTAKSSPLWRLNRLRAMSLREIGYRIARAATSRLEGSGIGLAPVPPSATGRSGNAWCSPIPSHFDAAVYRAAADRILAGRFDIFAMHDAELGFPPDWNRDPKTGTIAPLGFGKNINYRDQRIVGDIKYLWEPSRHLELVTLAQAYHLTGDTEYAEGCRALLESWFDACPYPLGIHWSSSLELALRVVNWFVAWHLLGGDDAALFSGESGAAFRARWQASIFQHCHFIEKHLSFHSSANNHLLGEYMGLLIGALGWPMWPQSARWRELAAAGFETEALRQNAADGVNREQAIYYQHEVIDMMLLCAVVGRANGQEFRQEFYERLERMLDFLAAVMDRNGNVPMTGDADSAVMVRFEPSHDFDVYRSVLAAGAILFRRPDFAAKVGRLDDKCRWMFGDVDADFMALSATRPTDTLSRSVPRAFEQGGYYLLGQDLDGPDEVRLLADAGPLGYLSIAAHGHADALAFTLSVRGQMLLIDPGTYAYHTEKHWRDYFKGTSAHNTVRIDGLDQSVSGGNFLWLHHAQAWCETFETNAMQDCFVGAHDGYERLPDPVEHRRRITFDKAQGRVDVTDQLRCTAAHDVEVFWHFAEDCQVELTGSAATIRKAGITLHMSVAGADLQAECIKGEESPPLGWVSYSLDEKVPSPTLRWYGRVAGAAGWTTTLLISIDA